jgi:asparagine synthase (glutamine-hydrolysing)
MCGICGIYDISSVGVDKSLLKRMCDVMNYRGPDDEGYYTNGSIGLGMRRLSVIDLHTGKQPIHNENQTIWIVFNGEIYNFPVLRAELERKGHRFYTHTDTEAIVHLYEEYKESCVTKLNGMFSFALWDDNKKLLMIARDRLGEKPLYYSSINGKIIFGSEIKCILQSEDYSKEIDYESLDSYFTYLYIPAPRTIFKDIKKLLPGHIMLLQNNNIKIFKYWEVEYNIERNNSIEYFKETFLEKFRDAVKIRLISDVPLGALLSGGIDSSAIVAIMSEYSSKPVETFNIGYGEEGAYYDEREYAEIVSKRFETSHHEFILKPDISKLVPEIIKYFDEPFADSSAIPNYYVSQMTKQYVTVALSGLGGDEIAGGYERYIGIILLKYYKKIPKHFREKVIAKLVSVLPDSKKGSRFVDRAKRFVNTGVLPVEEAYFNYISSFKSNQKESLYSEQLKNKLRMQKAKEIFDEYFSYHDNLDILNRILFADIKMYLTDDLLTLTDRMSMAHSLEMRVPFIDYNLVEFMASVPPEMKIKGLTKKYLLKKAFKNILPEDILNRKKRGFTAPLSVWLRDELTSYLRSIISKEKILKTGLLRWEKIEIILNQHLSGKENYHSQIWALLIFLVWYSIYIENLEI